MNTDIEGAAGAAARGADAASEAGDSAGAQDSGTDSNGALAHAHFWRGLDELDGAPAVAHPAERVDLVSWRRRDFMKVMGASLALAGGAGCARTPLEPIVPYREGADQTNYGKPVFFASVLARDGYGAGVLVETNMGRPTKIEGNPAHPASLGATDIFAQAEVLALWDPNRSQNVLRNRAIDTWERFLGDLQSQLRGMPDGKGLAVLTETVTSPTLHRQLRALLAKYPRAAWHQYQPLNRDNVYAGMRAAAGEPLEPRYRFADARVVVALDADFAGSMPGCVRYAHDLMDARQARDPAAMNRLYVAEATPSITGAIADHRRITRASEIAALARALQQRVMQQAGVGTTSTRNPNGSGTAAAAGAGDRGNAAPATPATDPWLDAAAADLVRNRGAAVVIAGDRQPPEVHALVHAINTTLGNIGNTVELGPPVAFEPASQQQSIATLVAAMQAGEVRALLMLGGNPVYNAPADLAFGAALVRVPWKAHLGLHDDETSFHCTWHVPAAHALETWSDIRAYDGTVAIQQPCIAPLYDGRSAHEIVSAMSEGRARSAYEVVRETWQAGRSGDFEAFWRDALWRGVIAAPAGPAAGSSDRGAPRPPKPDRSEPAGQQPAAEQPPAEPATASDIELLFAPDPTIGDGRHANNAWLQELPKPLTTLTWDNAVLLSPALASRLGLASEDVIELASNGRRLRAPVWIMPGHVDHSVTLHLGHGRTRAGEVGNGVGADAYALRSAKSPWIADVKITRTGARYPLAAAQPHNRMEGRDLARTLTRDAAVRCGASQPDCAPAHREDAKPSLYPQFPYNDYKWAMSIDLSRCIGCAACTIACQAENNVPVVGKEEVRRGREMHWIRVDRYYAGPPEKPRTLFQPVPCMQCEHAPCEEVCPVEASVHDAEGLNVQVYNRCVGTRFCSNNCPYKVRRFNFLSYTRDTPSLNAQRNPEVTVRMRGVMEKCSYCIQRIANGRVNADKENRRIADGEVVTACQAVCPTGAIVFGDLNDPASAVNRRKSSPLDYALLAELNTRPRTTYLPKITNPAPGVDPT